MKPPWGQRSRLLPTLDTGDDLVGLLFGCGGAGGERQRMRPQLSNPPARSVTQILKRPIQTVLLPDFDVSSKQTTGCCEIQNDMQHHIARRIVKVTTVSLEPLLFDGWVFRVRFLQNNKDSSPHKMLQHHVQ